MVLTVKAKLNLELKPVTSFLSEKRVEEKNAKILRMS